MHALKASVGTSSAFDIKKQAFSRRGPGPVSGVPRFYNRHASHTFSADLTSSAAAVATSGHKNTQQHYRCCCCQAAAPPSAAAAPNEGGHSVTHDPQHQQQQPSAALWSDDDIFEAFGEAKASAVVTPTVDDVENADPMLQHSAAQHAAGHLDGFEQQPQSQQSPLQQVLVPHHSRHQRRFNQHLAATLQQPQQQQQPGLQQLQLVMHDFHHVHLLQRIAGVNSWSTAASVLQQEAASLRAEHVALLWNQLTPKLMMQQQAAAERAAHTTGVVQQQRHHHPPPRATACSPQQQQLFQQLQLQRGVLQQLCGLTAQCAASLTPQALARTLQGLAAAVGAGKLACSQPPGPTAPHAPPDEGLAAVAAAGAGGAVRAGTTGAAPSVADVFAPVHLDPHLPDLLLQQLLRVAATCSPHTLAACLASTSQLGLCQNNTTSSSSGGVGQARWCCCCATVLDVACRGQLGEALQGGGRLSGTTAAQLLHSLAGCSTLRSTAAAAAAGLMPGQQQQQEEVSAADGDGASSLWQVLQQLADAACCVLTDTAGSTSWGLQQTAAAAAGGGGSSGEVSAAMLSVAVCGLQACAVLQLLPDPCRLEQLLSAMQPHIAAGRLQPLQLLQLLRCCHDLGVEPWPEWLNDCYNTLRNSLQGLEAPQLLQLQMLLGQVTNLQPGQQLLHQLAKVTAVHSSRYSLAELASLLTGLKQLGYRPEPYWLKDFLTASARLMMAAEQQQFLVQQQAEGSKQQQLQGHQQQQHQQQQQLSSVPPTVLLEVLEGVLWLSPAKPPVRWLKALEQALLAAAQADSPAAQPLHVGAKLPAGCAADVVRILQLWGHAPCTALEQVLAASREQQQLLSLQQQQPQQQRPGERYDGSSMSMVAPQGHQGLLSGGVRVQQLVRGDGIDSTPGSGNSGSSSAAGHCVNVDLQVDGLQADIVGLCCPGCGAEGDSDAAALQAPAGGGAPHTVQDNHAAAAPAAAPAPQHQAANSSRSSSGLNQHADSEADRPATLFDSAESCSTHLKMPHEIAGRQVACQARQVIITVRHPAVAAAVKDLATETLHPLAAHMHSMQQRPVVKSWYRARLLQLMRGSQSNCANEAALAVL